MGPSEIKFLGQKLNRQRNKNIEYFRRYIYNYMFVFKIVVFSFYQDAFVSCLKIISYSSTAYSKCLDLRYHCMHW